LKEEISSDFFVKIANGFPSPNIPVSSEIFAINPLSVDSKVTVALSVSTSQIASPTSIWSPYFTFHLTILPYVIVGDNAGIYENKWQNYSKYLMFW
jgi:hypothetical protein